MTTTTLDRGSLVRILAAVAAIVVMVPVGLRIGALMPEPDTPPTTQPRHPPAPPAEMPFDFEQLTVPREAILRGGPPKDGIRALNDPTVCAAGEVKFLDHRAVSYQLSAVGSTVDVPLTAESPRTDDVRTTIGPGAAQRSPNPVRAS